MTHIQEKRCGDILTHYGSIKQMRQTAEECAELIRAIMRELEPGFNTTAHYNFIEELADVEIMVEQMKQTLTDTDRDTLLRVENAKINRQLQRIAKGE